MSPAVAASERGCRVQWLRVGLRVGYWGTDDEGAGQARVSRVPADDRPRRDGVGTHRVVGPAVLLGGLGDREGMRTMVVATLPPHVRRDHGLILTSGGRLCVPGKASLGTL